MGLAQANITQSTTHPLLPSENEKNGHIYTWATKVAASDDPAEFQREKVSILPFLEDHVVHGSTLMPGTIFCVRSRPSTLFNPPPPSPPPSHSSPLPLFWKLDDLT